MLPFPLALAAHPRSRGEHVCACHGDMVEDGSSPLARGTRRRRASNRTDRRLIPARAGNTVASVVCKSPWTAHPRSRGEHCMIPPSMKRCVGSSPLARGTLMGCLLVIIGFRLIPARAGNTAVRRSLSFACSAHPRSRGEHFKVSLPNAFGCGSSPLARGTLLRRA